MIPVLLAPLNPLNPMAGRAQGIFACRPVGRLLGMVELRQQKWDASLLVSLGRQTRQVDIELDKTLREFVYDRGGRTPDDAVMEIIHDRLRTILASADMALVTDTTFCLDRDCFAEFERHLILIRAPGKDVTIWPADPPGNIGPIGQMVIEQEHLSFRLELQTWEGGRYSSPYFDTIRDLPDRAVQRGLETIAANLGLVWQPSDSTNRAIEYLAGQVDRARRTR